MTRLKELAHHEHTVKTPKISRMNEGLTDPEERIKMMVNRAQKVLSPVWPLESFIACNPLQGYESMPFHEAIKQAHAPAVLASAGLEKVNTQVIKWLSCILDNGQNIIKMPSISNSLFSSFLKLAVYDTALHQNKKKLKDWLSNLPDSAEQTINACLDFLNLSVARQEAFIKQNLVALPGFAGYIKWKNEWQSNACQAKGKFTLLDYLALRLVITCMLWPQAAREICFRFERYDESVLQHLQTSEQNYAKQLASELLPKFHDLQKNHQRKEAQLIFCIDVRSEPLRRFIEQTGDYETLGFAGFFGLPLQVKEIKQDKAKACCPVLLKPGFHIDELDIAVETKQVKQFLKLKTLSNALTNLYQQLKYNISTPFCLAEFLGPWCGVKMLQKSFFPNLGQHLFQRIKALFPQDLKTTSVFAWDEKRLETQLTIEEQINYCSTILKLMGLTSGFAKLVVFCGHGGSTENNPYASALDCGACGGNHGGLNARLLATMLNNHAVRSGLEEKGIHIPFDTRFYGALHNTTTDEVEVYHPKSNAVIYPDLLQQLLDDLQKAQLKNNQFRAKNLNCSPEVASVKKKSQDWSETRPEWGLARNAAFIIAPRELTRDIDLEGRCFLHSYNWPQDPEAEVLEVILTAPLIVAQWINSQYLFSTLDNVAFGSGSKITQNVTGKIGVMQGNGSDLMHGLPLQSVMEKDNRNFHEPQRLLAFILAPCASVKKIIDKHQQLQDLFVNQWIRLLVLDPKDGALKTLNQQGHWVEFTF